MSFKLTYATMFNPPEELHQRFEAALARTQAALGQRHPLYIGGVDRAARALLRKRNPANSTQELGEFAAASASDADEALRKCLAKGADRAKGFLNHSQSVVD